MAKSRRSISLYEAAKNNRIELVQVLLASGIDPDAVYRNYPTCLYAAASAGHFEIVKVLLAAGASVDRNPSGSSTPLWVAAHHGHLDVVRLLLKKGAHIDAPSYGTTALYVAVENNHFEVAKILLLAGAKISAITSSVNIDILKEKINKIQKIIETEKLRKTPSSYFFQVPKDLLDYLIAPMILDSRRGLGI